MDDNPVLSVPSQSAPKKKGKTRGGRRHNKNNNSPGLNDNNPCENHLSKINNFNDLLEATLCNAYNVGKGAWNVNC